MTLLVGLIFFSFNFKQPSINNEAFARSSARPEKRFPVIIYFSET